MQKFELKVAQKLFVSFSENKTNASVEIHLFPSKKFQSNVDVSA